MPHYWLTQGCAEHVQLSLLAPPVNALNTAVLAELAEQLKECERQHVRTLLICSGLRGFFSAGADLNMLREASPAQARLLTQAFALAFDGLRAFSGISLALIEGKALGGGLELAMACDLRIATPAACMGLPEARLGLLPCAGGTQMLPRLVGLGQARRMILTGQTLTAETAAQIGLVDGVYQADCAMAEAQSWLADVRKAEPAALAACKLLLNEAASQPLNQGYAEECEAFIRLFRRTVPAQGVQAFFTKQSPPWHKE